MTARETDGLTNVKISREIPLWGIFTMVGSILVLSYSVYAGYVKTVDAVDKLSISVEKLKDSGIENTIRYNKHDDKLSNHDLQLQKLERDIEELKNKQRWGPK